jgi:hypothetical protein
VVVQNKAGCDLVAHVQQRRGERVVMRDECARGVERESQQSTSTFKLHHCKSGLGCHLVIGLVRQARRLEHVNHLVESNAVHIVRAEDVRRANHSVEVLVAAVRSPYLVAQAFVEEKAECKHRVPT